MSASSLANDYLGKWAEYFALFGAAIAAYWSLRLLCTVCGGFKAFFLARSLGLTANVAKMGAWAVVTGSTDGIGKAYAQELAKLGLKIVLISRNPDKLSDVAQEIESKYKVETKVISVDFTGGPEIYAKIKKELENVEVGVLVNNVGMAYSFPQYVGEVEKHEGEKKLHDLIRVNIDSVTMVTNIVLPGMVERKRGAIINISSGSALFPQAMMAVYSAAKAYVDYFSRALQVEYQSKGIIVQTVMPYFVATKLSKIRRASFIVPSPTMYARSALATLGVQTRTFGCLSHALQAWFMTCVPTSLFNKIGLSQMLNIRKRAIQRLEKSN